MGNVNNKKSQSDESNQSAKLSESAVSFTAKAFLLLLESRKIKKIGRGNINLENQKKLGSGAYSIVYSGKLRSVIYDESNYEKCDFSEEDIVVKAFSIKLDDPENEKELKMLLATNETKILSVLNGHYIAPPFFGYCYVQAPKRFLICSKKFDKSLGQMIDEDYKLDQKPELSRRLWIAEEVFRCAYKLHELGLTHQDFKSCNVLLNLNETPINVKLCDFGFSEPINALLQESSGTMEYAPPELSEINAGEKDLFSLYVLLCEIMNWEPPCFDYEEWKKERQGLGKPIPANIMEAREKGYREKISEDTPEWMADLIKQGWNTKPTERPKLKKIYDSTHRLFLSARRQAVIDQLKEVQLGAFKMRGLD